MIFGIFIGFPSTFGEDVDMIEMNFVYCWYYFGYNTSEVVTSLYADCSIFIAFLIGLEQPVWYKR
jgi:hypothetical protein